MLPRRGTQSDPSDQGGLRRRPAGREPRENATRAPTSLTEVTRQRRSRTRPLGENKDEAEPVAGTPMARSTSTAGTRARSKRGGPTPEGMGAPVSTSRHAAGPNLGTGWRANPKAGFRAHTSRSGKKRQLRRTSRPGDPARSGSVEETKQEWHTRFCTRVGTPAAARHTKSDVTL